MTNILYHSKSKNQYQQSHPYEDCHKPYDHKCKCRDHRCSHACRKNWAFKEAKILYRYLITQVNRYIYCGTLSVNGAISLSDLNSFRLKYLRLLSKHTIAKVYGVTEISEQGKLHLHYMMLSDVPIAKNAVKYYWTMACGKPNRVDHDPVRSIKASSKYMFKSMNYVRPPLFKRRTGRIIWGHRSFWTITKKAIWNSFIKEKYLCKNNHVKNSQTIGQTSSKRMTAKPECTQSLVKPPVDARSGNLATSLIASQAKSAIGLTAVDKSKLIGNFNQTSIRMDLNHSDLPCLKSAETGWKGCEKKSIGRENRNKTHSIRSMKSFHLTRNENFVGIILSNQHAYQSNDPIKVKWTQVKLE